MRRDVLSVARWEYHRFAKPRDLFLGIVFFAVTFGAFGFVGHIVGAKGEEPKTIGVLGGADMGLTGTPALERFHFVHLDSSGTGVSLDAARSVAADAFDADELDGLLAVLAPDRARLIVSEERGWQQELLVLVAQHRQAHRLTESGLEPAVLEALTASVDVARTRLEPTDTEGTRADPKTVLIVVGTMLLGLFLGFSYVFVAITGEKTQKVTESVLAAITPQEWIDGKILGLTLVVLANVVCYGIGYLLYKVAAVLILKEPFTLPAGVGDPGAVVVLMGFAILGFGFWFTLFAVVAATINDPNSSSRSSLMFLPFLPLGLTLIGLDQPDALWMRVLALLPGVSPAAMPVRIMRGDPHVVEILLSLLFLAVMVAVFRRTAGRVFGVSMLMTGKEPSWREVWRWARQG